MINNTSLQRWHRASARSLDTQFVNEIIQGMNCSPFEANAILDKVHQVYQPLMETADSIKPGQIRFSLADIDVAPGTPLMQARQRLVTLTLDAGQEDRDLRRDGGVVALRRHRMLRVCEEAFEQGGLFTLEALADFFNCGVRTLVSDLAFLRAQQIVVPLRSTVKDMGRAITHRRLIVEKWLAGLEYSEIARATCHSVASVANYIEKYKRVAVLVDSGFDLDAISVIARISPALARAFTELVANAQPVAHRREQLDELTKKNGTSTLSQECRI